MKFLKLKIWNLFAIWSLLFVISAAPLPVAADHCSKNLLPGFPNWSKGLTFNEADCTLDKFKLSDIWQIVINVTQMVLFLAGVAAVIFIIFSGIQYITSAGDPERTAKAKKTLTNAVIGLVIAIFASTIVGFVGGFF